MKTAIFMLTLLLFTATQAGEQQTDAECLFYFDAMSPCQYGDITVTFEVNSIADGEIVLQALHVDYQGTTHRLSVGGDIEMFRGDIGSVHFDDINFDGIPDLAVSTSFGIVNLALDYWLLDAANNRYLPVGNYIQFTLDADKQLLNNTVKINAATYQYNSYQWQGDQLQQVSSSTIVY